MNAEAYLCHRFGVSATDPSPIELSGQREMLGEMFAVLGFRAGAEIGVASGRHAQWLLRCNRRRLKLLAVDAWQVHAAYSDRCGHQVPPTQAYFDRQYARAKAALSRYRGARIIRGFSGEVAATVADASLDFVYLDANHEEVHVRADLEAWVPKVRPGGIVSGHDYSPNPRRKYRQGGPGVVAAVNAYTAEHEIRPWFVLEENWLWIKKPLDSQ